MNLHSIHPRLLSAVVVSLGLLAGSSGVAQTYTLLKSFAPGEGRDVQGGLAVSGATLYGTTYSGGTGDNGTLYRLNTDGTGFETLYNFTAYTPYANVDGAHPTSELVVSGNTLFGTAINGGSLSRGTVYKFDVGTRNFTVLTSFEPAGTPGSNPGSIPDAPLILSGSTLYGEVYRGMLVYGGMFRINTNGTGYSVVAPMQYLNGIGPVGGLLISGSRLFGTANSGGYGDVNGTVFATSTNGTTAGVIRDFVNSGSQVSPGLALSGEVLFGTTTPYFHPVLMPSPTNSGTIFKVDTSGANYSVLKAFSLTASNSSTGTYTNADGAGPNGRLILYGATLYGTTAGGGHGGFGTVYKINTDGSGFTVLKHFAGPPNDGAQPIGRLAVAGAVMFGTTSAGGTFDRGTVFSFPVPPLLSITSSGEQVVLLWPTNAPDYELQSTTNFVSPVNWTAVLPPPTVVGDQNAVTNSISEAQQFYRLIKP